MDEKKGESTFLEDQMSSKNSLLSTPVTETGRRESIGSPDEKQADHEAPDSGELTEAELADLAGAPILGSSDVDNWSAGSEKIEFPQPIVQQQKPSLFNTSEETPGGEEISIEVPQPKFLTRKRRTKPSKKDPARDHVEESKTKTKLARSKLGPGLKPSLRAPRRSSTRLSKRAKGEGGKEKRTSSDQRTQKDLVSMEDQRIERLEQKFANNTVILDIGGKTFSTTYATITKDPGSRLANMVRGTLETGNWKDHFFVDRDPSHFRHVLNFLRQGSSYFEKSNILDGPTGALQELKQEAEYYKIHSLTKYLINCEKQYSGKRRKTRRSRSQAGALNTKAFETSSFFTPSKSTEAHRRSSSNTRVMPLSAQNLALHSGSSEPSLNIPFDARSQASDFSEFTDLESVAGSEKPGLNILSRPKQSIMLQIDINELQNAASMGDFDQLERIITSAADHHYKDEQERVLKFQKQVQEENERKKKKVKQYKEKVAQKAKKVKAHLTQQKKEMEKQRSAFFKEKHEMQKEREQLKNYVATLPDEKELRAQQEYLDRERAKLQKALARLEASRKENTVEKEKLRSTKKILEDKIRALQQKQMEWDAEKRQFQEKQAQQEEEKAATEKALADLKRDRDALEAASHETANLSSEMEQRQSIMNEKAYKLEQKLLQAERERQELLFRLEQFQKEKAKFERDREELQYQIDNHKKYNLEKADLQSKQKLHSELSKDLEEQRQQLDIELQEVAEGKESLRERESELVFREARLSGNQEVLEKEKLELQNETEKFKMEKLTVEQQLDTIRRERADHLEEMKRLTELRERTNEELSRLSKKQDHAEEISRTSLLLQNRLHSEQTSMDTERENFQKEQERLSEDLEKLRIRKAEADKEWKEITAAKKELATERSKAQKELDEKKEKVELDLNLLQSETFKLQKLKLETDDILREKENVLRMKSELEIKQTDILRKEVDIEFALEALKRDKDSLASKERIIEVQSTELQARTKEIQQIKSSILRQQEDIEERRRQSELDLSSEKQKWERKNQQAVHMTKQAETDKIQLESTLRDMKIKMEEHNAKMQTDMAELAERRQRVEDQLRRAAESESIRAKLDRDQMEFDSKFAAYREQKSALDTEKRRWEQINMLSAKDLLKFQKKIDDLLLDNAELRTKLEGKDKDLEKRLREKNDENSDLQNQINSLNLEIIDLSNQSHLDVIDELKQQVAELQTELKNEKEKPNLGEMTDKTANKFIKAQWRRLEDERGQLQQMKRNLDKQEKDLKKKQAKVRQQQLDVNRWQAEVERSSRQVQSIESQMKEKKRRRESLLKSRGSNRSSSGGL